MRHWLCMKCGLQTESKSGNPQCTKFLGHNFKDGLAEAIGDTFVWSYRSTQSFQQGSVELTKKGWALESASEVTRPVGVTRLAMLGPLAFAARPKGVIATFKRTAKR